MTCLFRGISVFAAFYAIMVSSFAGEVRAQTAACSALDAKGKAFSLELFRSMHPYDGCDETFERCLTKKPPAPVVLRLAGDICRLVKAGRSRQEVELFFAKRAQSMLPSGKPAVIAVDGAFRAGNPQAPVTAVVYACARCPFCKVIVPVLYDAVISGSLKDKVKLYFRPFPLKDHPGALEGGLAMVAAARLGKFWPFILQLYGNYDRFCPRALPDWAGPAGLERDKFEKEYAKSETREALVGSKQEGIRNNVKATPTLFINGRKYVYEMSAQAMIDVLLEEYERLAP
jgi:protein-disulfide isomerase